MNKIILGVCGRAASGKSTLAKALAGEIDGTYIDVDKLGHSALKNSSTEIIQAFGKSILDENKNISRKKLGAVVFKDENKLRTLEHILHPKMKEALKNEIAKVDKNIVFEAAILYRMKLENLADKIIYVDTSDEKIIARLKTRKINEEIIQNILSSQKDVKNYGKLADIVIRNNDSLDELYSEVKKTAKSLPYVRH